MTPVDFPTIFPFLLAWGVTFFLSSVPVFTRVFHIVGAVHGRTSKGDMP
jgi:hypothetical protein